MDAANADVQVFRLRLGADGVDEIAIGVDFFAGSAFGDANGIAGSEAEVPCCCEDVASDVESRGIGEWSRSGVLILTEMTIFSYF